MTGDPFAGVLAMFVMATSIYFIKYAARAMTDVPFTFFFLAAVCAWLLGEDDPRWFLAAAAFAAMAQLTRALAGISIPLLFAIDLMANRRRPPLRYLIAAALIAFVPPAAWYAHGFTDTARSFRPPFHVHEPGSDWRAVAPLATLYGRVRVSLDDLEILLAVATRDDRRDRLR